MKKIMLLLTLAPFFNLTHLSAAPGKVYLVLGSDTAIWDGMSVSNYHSTYNQSLYTDPSRNATRVMDPSWRERFKDSYGTTLKLTWWMMAGNIFRYATNTNFPIPNIMTLYLMQKYYGAYISEVGDELTLHYHTFVWTDYDQDGVWYWNQAKDFNESRADFDFTLCQFLLEENVFPVSFRSGWHAMDDHWQHYLNELLPYSLHNDWPSKRTYDPEPIDNIYDWSQSPSTFIPWHPSLADYRLPGDGPGWNVRSTHFNTARGRNLLDSLFNRANQGQDQLACFWGHLPEEDFISNIAALDSLAQKAALKYPNVKFRYCTAVEAYQFWQNKVDTLAPDVTFEEIVTGEDVAFRITTAEPIFQRVPFVAVKDIYENYSVLPCNAVGENTWQTTSLKKAHLAKVGVAVCDTLGNQTKQFIIYKPDDIYIDNETGDYQEISGNWSTITATNHWGRNARVAQLATGDTVRVSWHPSIPQTALYNIYIQMPETDNPAQYLTYKVFSDGTCLDTITVDLALTPKKWHFLTTVNLPAYADNYLLLESNAINQVGKKVAVDVVKFSALVRDYDLICTNPAIDFGMVPQVDTAYYELTLTNGGYKNLEITNITAGTPQIIVPTEFPIIIPPMSSIIVPIGLATENLGPFNDTLKIQSNDAGEPTLAIPVNATISTYFVIVDNEDFDNYYEFGTWRTSVAQAYGPSSRYAPLNQNPRAYARYTTQVKLDGIYDLHEIVPTTVNASDTVLYVVLKNNIVINSVIVNQNTGSGNWVKIISGLPFRKGESITVRVVDTGRSSNSGWVLRADAIKLTWQKEISSGTDQNLTGLPTQFELSRNFPNPFNAATTINYAVPTPELVRITVYNALGQVVAEPVNYRHTPGYYSATIRLDKLSSGFYFCRLTAGETVLVRKILLLK